MIEWGWMQNFQHITRFIFLILRVSKRIVYWGYCEGWNNELEVSVLVELNRIESLN